jgi:hypothetical protein
MAHSRAMPLLAENRLHQRSRSRVYFPKNAIHVDKLHPVLKIGTLPARECASSVSRLQGRLLHMKISSERITRSRDSPNTKLR